MAEIVEDKRPNWKKTTWNDLEAVPDMVTNILSKLPVKNILSSKAVSKFWEQITDCLSFKKQQLLYSKANPTYMIYPFMSAITDLYLADADGIICGKVSIPGCEDLSTLTIISSHNGLICFISFPWNCSDRQIILRREGFKTSFYVEPVVVSNKLDIRICNPATREVKLLPKGSPSEGQVSLGVAYGPGISEYRVYRFFIGKVAGEFEEFNTFCEVYSTRTGVWQILGCIQYIPLEHQHVFVAGSVFWFVGGSEAKPNCPVGILAVDENDQFRYIPLPEKICERSFLVDFGGRLGLIAIYEYEMKMNVWLLTESDELTWVRRYHEDIPFGSMVFVESVAVREGVFFFISTDHYFLYNPEIEVWWEQAYDDVFEKISPVVFPYTQSLLPCDGSLGTGGEGNSEQQG